MPLTPGSRLGPYEIVAPLGAGGMGEVYRARDTRLGRDVAVKVVPQHLSANPEIRARFEREAKTVSNLNHPNICTLFDVGREGDTDYLVMELIEGDTLGARLARGPLPASEVLRLGAQIADALSRAHGAGVVHRDLKPGNVMLTKSGAKLMDFGLARATGLASASAGSGMTQSPTMAQELTAEGTLVGTFQYMAPEQLEGNEADARSDLWALGCVLYEMLTGRRAYQGKSQAVLISAIMTSDPPPISAVAPMTPPALARVVSACLAKQPEDRVQTAHDVKLQLDWIREAGSDSGLAAPVTARRKGPAPLAWALAMAVVAVVAMAVLLFGGRGASREPVIASIAPPSGSKLIWFWSDHAISPDGRMVAFTTSDSSVKSIWIRPLGSVEARRLVTRVSDAAVSLFWSYDSRSLAYFGAGKLSSVAVDGGTTATICDARAGRGGTWNRDGVILFAPAPEGPLMRVASNGGEPIAVTTLDTARHEAAHRFPSFLPDQDHFLFAVLPSGPKGWDTYVGSLKSKTVKKVLTAGSVAVYSASGHLVFERDGRIMAQRFDTGRLETSGEAVPIGIAPIASNTDAEPVVSASGNGHLLTLQSEAPNARVRWFDRAGAPLDAVPLPPGPWRVRQLSPDDQRAAVLNGTDIWTIDLRRAMPTRFAPTMSTEATVCWSPDGSQLAFASKQTGRMEIYVGRSDGGAPPELVPTTASQFKYVCQWSPDGKSIVFRTLESATQGDVWLLPLTGDRKPVPLLNSSFHEAGACVSPDGRWLAYISDESGAEELYVQSFPELGRKVRISRDGAYGPWWSGRGNELLFASGSFLMSVAAEPGEEYRPGTPEALFPPSEAVSGIASSARGERFLVSEAIEKPRPSLQLFLNWSSMLERNPATER